jgi:hypothetical protein
VPSVLVCEQSIATQLDTVTQSQQDSVESEVNRNEIDDAPSGAMIPDMRSEFE